jgi:hypothetical protein
VENVPARDAGENAAAPITLAPEDVAHLTALVERAQDWNAAPEVRDAARHELAAYLAACLRYPRYPD